MMRLTCVLLAVVLCAGQAEARTPNYDEAKVGAYDLPDVLTFADGRRVTDAASWAERRREIVRLYAREMFGRTPPAPEAVETELVEEGPTAHGMGIRRQYRMWFRADRTGPFIDWPKFLPKAVFFHASRAMRLGNRHRDRLSTTETEIV